MLTEASFICVYCLQLNEISVDVTAGPEQEYVEDCQICCRPNLLKIIVRDDLEEAEVVADLP